MGRAPCCDKAQVKRGPWSPEEDATLKSYVQRHGNGGNWIALPHKAGLKRCGKSCRLRWLNYLRPDIKHGNFTEEEDAVICSLYRSIGSRWSVIATHLTGRTDNDVKNHWNTKLKKKIFPSRQLITIAEANTPKTRITAHPAATVMATMPEVIPEKPSCFHGSFPACVPSQLQHQLPELMDYASWCGLSPATSSSSRTLENLDPDITGSSLSCMFGLDGLGGCSGDGCKDLIFGGNPWTGGSGNAEDLFECVGLLY